MLVSGSYSGTRMPADTSSSMLCSGVPSSRVSRRISCRDLHKYFYSYQIFLYLLLDLFWLKPEVSTLFSPTHTTLLSFMPSWLAASCTAASPDLGWRTTYHTAH